MHWKFQPNTIDLSVAQYLPKQNRIFAYINTTCPSNMQQTSSICSENIEEVLPIAVSLQFLFVGNESSRLSNTPQNPFFIG